MKGKSLSESGSLLPQSDSCVDSRAYMYAFSVCSFVHFLEGWIWKCAIMCVLLRTVCRRALWVFHLYRLYHQLGQFLSLCLINGLPQAPLCRELRSVCSCSFAPATVCTHKPWDSQTCARSPTGVRVLQEDNDNDKHHLCDLIAGLFVNETSVNIRNSQNDVAALWS